MPKTLVITMNEQYPFFMARPTCMNNNGQILVRQVLKINDLNHSHMLNKATFLKNLRNKNLIKVENLVEQDSNIHIFYENVESKYDWRDPQIITEVYNQLKNLTVYLVNIGVKAPLKSSRLGITDKQILKYYLAIDFEWDTQKDEQFLSSYYQNQLNKLFGVDFVAKSSILKQQKINNRSPSIREKPYTQPNRKVSFATLSSRQDRFAHLEKQMNMIKSSYERMSPSRKESNAGMEVTKIANFNSQMTKSQSNQKGHYYRAPLLRDKDKLAKKWQDRKFSGDIKHNIQSTKKLQQKQSDIKSQRGAYPTTANRLRQRYHRENNQQQIETINSKSRIEEMKYQEYIHITKSQKDYLQDFISVLENETPLPSYTCSPNTSSKATRPTESSTKLEDALSLTAEALRIKTQEAILNSRKIINKVKAFPVKN